jgi:putative virulence-associated protein E|nr:MAG TPA: virulence associated protein E [Caudoviricetes sp.]
MKNDRKILISSAGSRKAVVWSRSSLLWSEFTQKLKVPVRGQETMEEYLNLPKQKQDELKDVGGFVGGTFKDDRRKAANVEGRDLITLDLDNIPTGKTEDIIKRVTALGCASLVYSTRKHTAYAPRLRIVIPLDKTASADEYEPCARKLASLIGIEFCDPTTFEASRLMYWASTCADSEYVYVVNDMPFCSLIGILNTYGDWQDVTQWPQVPGAEAIERRRLAKQEDPTTKSGVVGAFCRTYRIQDAMEKFIPGMYEPTAIPGRYTYTGGSTAGGAVIYDGDLFMYSHHATDPCSGQLVNAFDLIRLHKFANKDDEAKPDTPANRLPSYTAMVALALADKSVADLMTKEKFLSAREAFASSFQVPESANKELEASEDDLEWVNQLARNESGAILKTVNNMIIILKNDPSLKDKIVTDEFAGRGLVMGAVPWNVSNERRQWDDADDAGAFWYMETFYDLGSRDRLDDALTIVGASNTINEVKEYLQGLKWDGKKRVERLLPDYLGAEDSVYTHAVMKKSLCAAVARAMSGAVKYDYMPIFTGPQGLGKSTFLAILGKNWFSDSLATFEGKEAAELIQGTWINEVGELTAMTRQETSAVKQFLSKKEDIYRAAYGRRTERHPRRCVFFGTSNDAEFLKDATGNRRFWPVDVGVFPAKKSVWKDLPEEVDQVWAEAYMYWSLGEPLYLNSELEEMAKEQQEQHKELTGKEGVVLDYLDKMVPANWDSMALSAKRAFIQGNATGVTKLKKLDRVCAVEVWEVCFGGDKRYMKKSDAIEINAILGSAKGWVRTLYYTSDYGRQRGFKRI